MHPEFDIIIVGAGPAGSSCALSLKESGLNVALIDKSNFPRDKICGDALSVDVVNQLPMLSQELAENFFTLQSKLSSTGVRIFSPELISIDIPFVHKGHKKTGYISPRLDFDYLLFGKVKESTITVVENCQVEQIQHHGNKIIIHTSTETYRSKMIVGADGAHSVVKRFLCNKPIERDHHSAGLRQYYEGLTWPNDLNHIELYFFREILPGYLWIFPMHGNRANVGIGVLSSTVSKGKLNLRDTLVQLINTHPLVRDRFKDAKPLENIKGHGLPLGSTKRQISGSNFLLVGDAAGLIDPFTGEGIGNAIRSGRVAAMHLKKCFDKNNFSASFNKEYDKEIYRRMGKEFRVSRALQTLCKYPSVFNYVIRKAVKNPYWHQFLMDAMADIDQKEKLTTPGFYYRLLFK